MAAGPLSYTRADFDHSPMLVFYEITRACDLKCFHCRADAQLRRHPLELSEQQSLDLVDELARFPKPPLLVLTGGDPLKRADVCDIIRHALRRCIPTAMTPSVTPLLTDDAITALKRAGLQRLAVSIDGADAATHDGFRGVAGSFDRTLQVIRHARAIGLPVQVNSTVTKLNEHQLERLAAVLAPLDIVLWSVFFLIPVGRGQAEQRLAADECESVFARLWSLSRTAPFAIKTTEAPHYRRFALQQIKAMPAAARPGAPEGRIGTNDGKGVMFVGHTGEIYPTGFLPQRCGRFPADSLVKVYQEHPAFVMLRDAERLEGKCGVCEYREICGGSRARAFALTGNPMAPEPDCAYLPPRWTPVSAPATQPAFQR